MTLMEVLDATITDPTNEEEVRKYTGYPLNSEIQGGNQNIQKHIL